MGAGMGMNWHILLNGDLALRVPEQPRNRLHVACRWQLQ